MLRHFIALIAILTFALPVQAVTLKIATVAPDGTPWMAAMKTAAKEIRERTHGRVKLRFFPGGVMGDDRTVLRKMRIGQLHGGAFTNGGMALVVPEANLYSIPLLVRDRAEAAALRARFDDEIKARLAKAGLVAYAFSDAGFAYLMSNHPIRSADDLKGRKAWIPSGDFIAEATFKALGVSPVPLPIADVLTGLQTGLVDTIAAPFSGAVALQWHTRVKYVTDQPLSYIFTGLLFSERGLKRVKPQDREVIAEVISRLSEEFSRQTWENEAAARRALVKQGLTFLAPAPGTEQALRERIWPAMEALGRDGAFDLDLYHRMVRFLEERRQGHDGAR